jgi:hypothetical protein
MSLYDRFKNAQNATAFNEALKDLCERVEAIEAAQDHQGGPLVIGDGERVIRRRGRPPKAA